MRRGCLRHAGHVVGIDVFGLREQIHALLEVRLLLLLSRALLNLACVWLGRRQLLLVHVLLASNDIEYLVERAVNQVHSVLHVMHILNILRLLRRWLHVLECRCSRGGLLCTRLAV